MRGRGGFALLEVLVAFAILASAGTGMLVLVGDEERAFQLAAQREVELKEASQVLTAISLLGRRGLDQRIGARDDGAWVTRVDRPRRGLYRLSVAEEGAPDAELVVTVVQREEDP